MLALLAAREQLMAERIEAARNSGDSWVVIAAEEIFLGSSNPIDSVMEFIANPLGGAVNVLGNLLGLNGDRRREERATKISVAELELRLSELQFAIVQARDAIALSVAEEVNDYELLTAQIEGLEQSLAAERSLFQLANVDYQYGGGSTEQMIGRAIALREKERELAQLRVEARLKRQNLERLVRGH